MEKTTIINKKTMIVNKIEAMKIIIASDIEAYKLIFGFDIAYDEWLDVEINGLITRILFEKDRLYSFEEIFERLKLCHMKAQELQYKEEYKEEYERIFNKYLSDEEFYKEIYSTRDNMTHLIKQNF